MGLSYTEKEYVYAVTQGIPALGFVLEEGISWPKDKSDTDRTLLKKIKAFKEKIKSKPVSFWKNGEDLYGRCSIALMKAFNAYPREGWVRASQVQDAAAAKEIVRLSSENADLRSRLLTFEALADVDLAVDKAITTMRANKRKLSIWKKISTDWENGKEVTLYQIFEVLAPEMQVEFALTEIARYTATNVVGVPRSELRGTWPTPRNTIRSLLADMAALGCVEPSGKKKPISDQDEYWSLSEFGARLLARMRRRRLESLESLAKIEETAGKDAKSDA